ncbi:MAG: hypothetical protein JXR37_30270 [Kiritimatiellae bacterium]|nr:hypothetical protein [Kiritimatiellia bacterium]
MSDEEITNPEPLTDGPGLCRPDGVLSYGTVARFFVPLALQAMSQSLTYPILAMIAARGSGGTLELAAYAQSSNLLFMLFNLSMGIVTTGLVYAKTRAGFRTFLRVNHIILGLVTVCHATLCLPVISGRIFRSILGLPPTIADPAARAFLYVLPVSILFILRNPYQVTLFNANRSDKAFAATVVRIVTAGVLAFTFSRLKMGGVFYAAVTQVCATGVEVLLSRQLALRYIRAQRRTEDTGTRASLGELLRFSFIFSLGGFFITLSAALIGAFIARAPEPDTMLPVYYVTSGLVGPLTYGATQIAAVVINFHGGRSRNRRLLAFACAAGLALSAVPLLFLTPWLFHGYYVVLQKFGADSYGRIRDITLILAFAPFINAVRSYVYGTAAYLKKPTAVLAGQSIFLGAALTTAFVLLNLGVPGHILGASSRIFATIISGLVIRASLSWDTRKSMPQVPEKAI